LALGGGRGGDTIVYLHLDTPAQIQIGAWRRAGPLRREE